MAFSNNQVRHLFVEKALSTRTNIPATDAVGTILPKGNSNRTQLYFQYKSPAGIICSDKIDTDKIMSITVKKASDLAKKLKVVEVTLDAAVSDTPVAGQEYITRIAYNSFITDGTESTHVEYGYVKATSAMDASAFYKEMAISLAKNTAGLVNIYVGTTTANTAVTATTKVTDLTDTYVKILIEEKEQEWSLGTIPVAYVPFDVQTTAIVVNGEEIPWGEVKAVAAINTVGNGKQIADLEYFCKGARGDVYRNMGFPYTIKSTYLVDPEKTYDVLDIHYAFVGSNESAQKSEKDLTIVCDSATSNALMKALITKINGLLPEDLAIPSLS